MPATTRQGLEQELLGLQETLSAVVDILGDDLISAAQKVCEIRDVIGVEIDEDEEELDDDEGSEED
jgi:hypothetical protein